MECAAGLCFWTKLVWGKCFSCEDTFEWSSSDKDARSIVNGAWDDYIALQRKAISLGPDDSLDQNSACEYIGALPRISRRDKVHLNLRTDDNDQVTAKANLGLSILRESFRMTEVTTKANLGLLLLQHSLSMEVPDECDRIGMLSTTPRSRSNVGFGIAKTQMHDNEANQGSQPKGRFSDVSIASSASDSSTSMLNPDEELADNIECQDFVFGTLPHELSLQLLQCLTVSDVCRVRASCRKVGAAHVLVDHFAYLVDPARPDVYLAAADVLQATDKNQARKIHGRDMQPRLRAFGCLFLSGHLGRWWQISPPPILKILAGMQSHCVKFPKIRTLLCKCSGKLFAVPDDHAQKYLVHDLLDILYSGSHGDKLRAAANFGRCSFDLGWLREECLATLRHVVNTTEREFRLHRVAAKALDVLMTNSKMHHGGCKTKMKGSG